MNLFVVTLTLHTPKMLIRYLHTSQLNKSHFIPHKLCIPKVKCCHLCFALLGRKQNQHRPKTIFAIHSYEN